MTSDSERVAALFEERSGPVTATRTRGAKVAEQSAEPRVGHRYVAGYSPPMPEHFWGRVTYSFQRGELVNIVVEETFRP